MQKFFLFLFSVLLSLIFFTGLVRAEKMTAAPSVKPTPKVEYALPYPGILPNHPLYFLKQLRDKILLLFIKDPVKRIEINLLLSDKRLKMGEVLTDGGDFKLAYTTILEGEEYMHQGVSEVASLRKTSRESVNGVVERLRAALTKHKEVIGELHTKDVSQSDKWKSLQDKLKSEEDVLLMDQ